MKRIWNIDTSTAEKYCTEENFPSKLKLLRWIGHQNWLVFGQDRLLRSVVDPDTCPHFLFEVDFFGKKYRGDLAHYIDWLVFCYGAAPYSEISLLREAASYLKGKRTGSVNFLDIGANAGHHTLFMAGVADQVWAFEPFPSLCSLIDEKIALNGLENVHLLRCALGEKDEFLNYYPGIGANSGIGTFLPDLDGGKGQPVTLEIKSGDRFFDEHGVGHIDIMKVDVEGFEPQVFRGLRNRIMRDRPVILTEISEGSRQGFGSQEAFGNCFYEGAEFRAVHGRLGRPFQLRPFIYETSGEVLVTPPEMHDFLNGHA
jgi:FkbM family methyltransferase